MEVVFNSLKRNKSPGISTIFDFDLEKVSPHDTFCPLSGKSYSLEFSRIVHLDTLTDYLYIDTKFMLHSFRVAKTDLMDYKLGKNESVLLL